MAGSEQTNQPSVQELQERLSQLEGRRADVSLASSDYKLISDSITALQKELGFAMLRERQLPEDTESASVDRGRNVHGMTDREADRPQPL